MKVDAEGVPLLIQHIEGEEVVLFNNVRIKLHIFIEDVRIKLSLHTDILEEYILKNYESICSAYERKLLYKYAGDKSMIPNIIDNTKVDRFYFGKVSYV